METIADIVVTMAENEQKVYDAGKQAERDAFWGALTKKGTRTDYANAFRDGYWTDANFNPTYTIAPRSADMTFEESGIEYSLYTDKFDMSKSTSGYRTFSSSAIKKLKKIDMRAVTWSSSTFEYCGSLESIDEFYPATKCDFNYEFYGCSNLRHIIFMSAISRTGLDMGSCKKLDKASIDSIFNWMSSNTSGLTLTLSKEAVDAALYDESTQTPGSETLDWEFFYEGRRSNWTIQLV